MLPRYDVELLLGRGGMGAVYKGRQKALDRTVAIKILPTEMEDRDASFAERFKNEARAMAKLNHPSIVAVHDFGETDSGLLYIVMEYIEGTDVARMCSEQGKLQGDHAKAITMHVCDALDYAHNLGILHRDIKPANIMVGYDGRVKVADFGLAKMTQTDEVGLTQSNMLMGTLHYMAPESLVLGTAVDHRADIYAVGVMLYKMLTGKLPQGLFEMPTKRVPGLDPLFDSIVSKALREDREDRYSSAGDMRRDLDGILSKSTSLTSARKSSTRFGKYQVSTHSDGRPVLLGSGASGKTYKAVHALLGTTVALKVIHENLLSDHEVKQRFINEARAISLLKHPHIAQLVDCDETEGSLYYAMEYCDGGDLEKLVSSRGPLPDVTVVQFGRQAARALAYVHDKGYLHRDLKPSNLMLSMVPGKDEANLKVIDFGLVKALGQNSGLTQKGQFRGTLLYTSPEQLREEEVDERADVFALGMTLWFLLIGGAPIKKNSDELATLRLSGKNHASLLPRKSHPALRALLTEMLHPEVKKRARNMHIVLSGIEECLVQMKRTNLIVPATSHQPLPVEPSFNEMAEQPTTKHPRQPSKPGTAASPIPPTPPPSPTPSSFPPGETIFTPRPQPISPTPETARRPTGLALVKSNQPLSSKFELLEESEDLHGELGMSYQARRISTGELVQLTKLDRTFSNDSQVMSQIETTASQAIKCKCVFLVQPLTILGFKDHTALVEESVEGPSLMDVLKLRQKLPLQESAQLLRQLAEACDQALQAELGALDLEPHRLTIQFVGMPREKLGHKEIQKVLMRPTRQWPDYVVRVMPDYLAAHRASSYGEVTFQMSATITRGMDEDADLPSRFARLTYRILSGMPVPAASKISRSGYVAISGLGEEPNRVMARVISRELQFGDCLSLLRNLLQLESLSLPSLPNHAQNSERAKATATHRNRIN